MVVVVVVAVDVVVLVAVVDIGMSVVAGLVGTAGAVAGTSGGAFVCGV